MKPRFRKNQRDGATVRWKLRHPNLPF